MAQRQYFRNAEWKNDNDLRAKIETFVKQGMKRKEMLSFLCRDYPQYSWSIRSIDQRMRYFNIYYTAGPENISVEDLKDAARKELEWPGQLLGYRAMHKNFVRSKGS
eukprot:gene10563-11684_t